MLTIVLCTLFTAVHILKTHWLHIRLMRKLGTEYSPMNAQSHNIYVHMLNFSYIVHLHISVCIDVT